MVVLFGYVIYFSLAYFLSLGLSYEQIFKPESLYTGIDIQEFPVMKYTQSGNDIQEKISNLVVSSEQEQSDDSIVLNNNNLNEEKKNSSYFVTESEKDDYLKLKNKISLAESLNIDCSNDISTYPTSYQCEWVKNCLEEQSLIPYAKLAFCNYNSDSLKMVYFYVPWAIALFYFSGTVADNYLTVSVITLTQLLGFLDTLAGCAVLAVVNAMGDVIGGIIIAVRNPRELDMFVGDVFGASFFLTTIVAGFVILSNPTKIAKIHVYSSVTDIIFLIAGLLLYLCFSFLNNVPVWAAAPLVLVYAFYLYLAWCQGENITKPEGSFRAEEPEDDQISTHGYCQDIIISECEMNELCKQNLNMDNNQFYISNKDNLSKTLNPQSTAEDSSDKNESFCKILPNNPSHEEPKNVVHSSRSTGYELATPTSNHNSPSFFKSCIAESSFNSSNNRDYNIHVASFMTRAGKTMFVSRISSRNDDCKGGDSVFTSAFIEEHSLIMKPLSKVKSCCCYGKKLMLAPLTLIWNLTIPRAASDVTWWWIPTHPFFIALFFFLTYQGRMISTKRLWLVGVGFGASVVLCCIGIGWFLYNKKQNSSVANTNKNSLHVSLIKNHKSKVTYILSISGVAMSLVWNHLFVAEILQCVVTTGYILNISSEILGMTVLAFGNSAVDLFANSSVARSGYTNMGLTSSYGASILLMFFAAPLVFAIYVIRELVVPTADKIEISNVYLLEPPIVVCIVGQIFSSSVWLLFMYYKDFKVERLSSIWLIMSFVVTSAISVIFYLFYE